MSNASMIRAGAEPVILPPTGSNSTDPGRGVTHAAIVGSVSHRTAFAAVA